MNQLVESLKRLYQSGKLDNKTILRLENENKISQEEREYIMNIE